MKRLLAMVLSLFIILSFAACSPQQNSAGEVLASQRTSDSIIRLYRLNGSGNNRIRPGVQKLIHTICFLSSEKTGCVSFDNVYLGFVEDGTAIPD